MSDSCLNQFDRKVVDLCSFYISLGSGDEKIEFQFPPRVMSDQNQSEWMPIDVWGMEPLKIHKGSGGRKISMEWEYVATDHIFNGSKVASICRKLKSYFFKFPKAWSYYPIVKIKYGEMIPDQITFRLMNVNMTHSPEMTDNGGIMYPIYTKVAISIEMVTDISDANSKGKPKIKVHPLDTIKMKDNWY
jgi:hypothetical protein